MASSPPPPRSGLNATASSPLTRSSASPSSSTSYGSTAASPSSAGGVPVLRRKLTYSSRDLDHPHNDPVYLQADDEDARANGIAHPYTMAMMWVFFVNNIIDTGALGLPNAFVESGWVLSCITLVASGLMSTITVLFTLEAMARTTGILEWKERQEKRWRRRRKRGALPLQPGTIPELGTSADSDLDEYEEGEVEEERQVLKGLSDSLKKNQEINPEAQKYGTFSPAETPVFASTAAPSMDGVPTLSLDVTGMGGEHSNPSSAKSSPMSGRSLPSASHASQQSGGASHETQPLLPPRHSASPAHKRIGSTGATMTTTGATTNNDSPRVSPKIPVRVLQESPRNSIIRAAAAASAKSSPSTGTGTDVTLSKFHSDHHATDASVAAALSGRSVSGNHLTTGQQQPHRQGTPGGGGKIPISAVATEKGYPITSPAHDPAHVHLLLHNKPIHHLSYRRMDFTLMSQLFGGYPLSFLTQFSVTVFSYVSLWATAAIFSQSMDTLYFQFRHNEDCNIYEPNQSAGCYRGYYVITGGYAVLVIYLTLKDIAETASTQAFLTGYRFFAFALMMLTCFIASFHDTNYFASADGVHPATWQPHSSGQALANAVPEVNWKGFDAIFTIATVSLVVQYNMPDIIGPLRTPYKRHSNGVLAVTLGAILACVALYIGLGLVCSFTIGVNAYPLITLNWSHFTGLDGGWGLLPHGQTVAWWAQAVKLGVMLFPPISMVSCFPLIAISLSENLRSSIPARIAAKMSDRQQKVICRVLACVPPLLLTCVSGQVDLIFKLAGFVAFLIQLIIPCLLQWTSIRYCKRIWGPGSEATPFSFHVLSKPFTVITVFLISCAFAIYSVVAMANEQNEDAPSDPAIGPT